MFVTHSDDLGRPILAFCYGGGLLASERSKHELLQDLESALIEWYDEKAKIMPAKIKQEIAQCNSAKEFNRMSVASQNWLHQQFAGLDEGEVSKLLSEFEEIKLGDDVLSLCSETYWSYLRKEPLKLKERIELIGLYWLENDRPYKIQHAPVGGGKIDWIWKLPVKERTHGILHVGLDTKSRRFICYEQTIGVYYPEGRTLERIRAEIVQDKIMAGKHIGKGWLKSNQ